MKDRRIWGALLALAFSNIGFAQALNDNGYSGGVYVNGGSYGGGGFNYGDSIELRAGDPDGMSATIGLKPSESIIDPFRTMMRFKAEGTGSFQLPSNRQGGTSAASNGDSVVHSTWSANYWPHPDGDHLFNASVDVSDSADFAMIGVQVMPAPQLQTTRLNNSTFQHDYLDNGAFDQDPTVGQVLLNPYLTPNITLNYKAPDYRFSRPDVTWQDGSTTPSMFSDGATSGMWLLIGDSIFGSQFNSQEALFANNESGTTKDILGEASSYTFDITMLKPGTYTGRYWSIPWDHLGYDNNELGNTWGGFIEEEHTELNIRVVPEPGSIAALALGGLMLLRRRSR